MSLFSGKLLVQLGLALGVGLSACSAERLDSESLADVDTHQQAVAYDLNNSADLDPTYAPSLESLDDYEKAANDVLLVRLIKAETDIEAAKTDLERTTILREWVYANTNYAVQTYQTFNVEEDWYKLVHPTRSDVSVGAHIGAHIRNEVGDMCGHLAWMLQRVYTLGTYILN